MQPRIEFMRLVIKVSFLASLLASEPGERAADEKPAWKSVSVQFTYRRASMRSTSSGMSRPGIILGPDHGRARYYEGSQELANIHANLGSRVYAVGILLACSSFSISRCIDAGRMNAETFGLSCSSQFF